MGFHRFSEGATFQRSSLPDVDFNSGSALSRGIMGGNNNKDTVHLNGEFTNTELLFEQFTQRISSVSTEQFLPESFLSSPLMTKRPDLVARRWSLMRIALR